MDDVIWILLGIAVIGYAVIAPALGIAGFVRAGRRLQEITGLRRELAGLRRQIEGLRPAPAAEPEAAPPEPEAEAPTPAPEAPETAWVTVGSERLELELALDGATRFRGLSGRTDL